MLEKDIGADTIVNNMTKDLFLHGQSKKIEIDSNYQLSYAVDFFKMENDSNKNKVYLSRIDNVTTIVTDTSTFEDLVIAAKYIVKGDKPAAIFYFNVSSKKILAPKAKGGKLNIYPNGRSFGEIDVEMDNRKWLPEEYRENGMYKLLLSCNQIKLFGTKDCLKGELLWPTSDGVRSKMEVSMIGLHLMLLY